jgi:ubiquinone/menaquinone biosynthesis C-methylase UbiE
MFPEQNCKTIIDIGGTRYQWDRLGHKSEITILNLSVPGNADDSPDNYHFVAGDTRNTSFPDKSFDLAFSNSVIEHVDNWDNQKQFAQEILRIGKQIYCQTPNKWFFVEPHLIAPFVHYLIYLLLRCQLALLDTSFKQERTNRTLFRMRNTD